MINHWNQFWFESDIPQRLGFFRILIVSYFLFYKLNQPAYNFQHWFNARRFFRKYWQTPALLRPFEGLLDDISTYSALAKTYKITLFFGLIGLLTPLSFLVAFFCGLMLMGNRHGLKMHHPVIYFHFVTLILALSPSGAYFSVDSLLFQGQSLLNEEDLSMMCNWGIQSLKVILASIIFATGFAKLRHVRIGEGFTSAGHLSSIIRMHDFKYFYASPELSISPILNRFRSIEFIASWGTLLIEFFFPVVLFFPATVPFMVPMFILLIIGFRVFLGPQFDLFTVSLIGLYFNWIF